VLYVFFQNIAFNFFENRHSNYFLRLCSDMSDPRATKGCADHLSGIIDFLKEANSLHLLSESISLGICLGGICPSLYSCKKSACFKLLFITFKKKVCLALPSSILKA